MQLAEAALAAGHCVVVGLQSTGEAASDATGLQPGAALPGFLSTTKELLCRWVGGCMGEWVHGWVAGWLGFGAWLLGCLLQAR